jgi:hypothetical protein
VRRHAAAATAGEQTVGTGEGIDAVSFPPVVQWLKTE